MALCAAIGGGGGHGERHNVRSVPDVSHVYLGMHSTPCLTALTRPRPLPHCAPSAFGPSYVCVCVYGNNDDMQQPFNRILNRQIALLLPISYTLLFSSASPPRGPRAAVDFLPYFAFSFLTPSPMKFTPPLLSAFGAIELVSWTGEHKTAQLSHGYVARRGAAIPKELGKKGSCLVIYCCA